ncbi:SprT family zinc-dependent metalloprotease [Sulfurimonas sp.]|uniref:M48 family metallopeptidase n=1 Tax=Sulfurimonas sp. TaxID=2022749 RepID=UPI0025E596BE|nr:SprT family zinc-dependent metalloprotease [Sulfurimonas sp.]MCK9473745.1 M48 family metallopeptidase [Sulfurimonas sp.]
MIIDYELIRSKRKSIGITIERDAKVVVNAPLDLDNKEIEKHVHKKRVWIWEKLAIKKSIIDNIASKKFVSGESFSYLGRNYRFQIVEGNSELKLKNGWFVLGQKKQPKSKEIFKAWYSEHLKTKIDERLESICKMANILKPDFKIMELGFRWGSCTKDGVLNFNWKIAMAPIGVIDYIIVHEIVHLKEHTHNEKFWKEVGKIMPNYAEKKEWLKAQGKGLSL